MKTAALRRTPVNDMRFLFLGLVSSKSPPFSLPLPSCSPCCSGMATHLPLISQCARASSYTVLCNTLFYLDATAGRTSNSARTPPCPDSLPSQPSTNFPFFALSVPTASPPSFRTTDQRTTASISDTPTSKQSRFRVRRLSFGSTWYDLRAFQLSPATNWSIWISATLSLPTWKCSWRMGTKIFQLQASDLKPGGLLGTSSPVVRLALSACQDPSIELLPTLLTYFCDLHDNIPGDDDEALLPTPHPC